MRVSSKVFLSLLLAGAGVVTGIALVTATSDYRSRREGVDQATQSAIELAAMELAPFDFDALEMTERSGEQFAFTELQGKVWIASMFFSSCPHQCRELNDTIAALHRDPEFKDVQFISITVDPVADTPAVLSEYAKMLGADPDRWLFLHGNMDDLSGFGKQLGIAAGYKSHTRDLVLLDATGKVRGYFAYNSGVEIGQLKDLVSELVAELQANDNPSDSPS